MTEKRITSFLRPSFIFLLIFDERVGEFEARSACAVSVPRMVKRSRRLFGTTAGPNSWMRIVVGKRIKIRRIFIKCTRARSSERAHSRKSATDKRRKPSSQAFPEAWKTDVAFGECISGAIEFPWPSPSDSPIVKPTSPSLCSPATPLIAPARLWDREIGWREDR